MTRPFRSSTAAALLAFSLALAAPEAGAQAVDPDTLAAARALHDEAVAALDSKDYAAACPKLERVVQMIPQGLGARLTLAECYEGAGRLASAWKIYVGLEEAAAKEGQRDRQRIAGKKAAELRPKLGRLAVVVPEALRGVPGLEVRRGGEAVGAAVWGIEVPVDRGEHVVTATAPGKRGWERKVAVEDGAGVSVEVEALEDERPAAVAPPRVAPPPRPAGPPGPAVPPKGSEPNESAASRWGTQRIAGVVLAGVGVVGVGVGAGFGLRAIVKKNESNADGHCHDGNQCDELGFALREDGHTAGTVSTVMFMVAGSAVLWGTTLFLTAPRDKVGTGAEVAVGPQGILLRGSW